MNNINNITLLDAYAKRLSNKQVNMLYESKMKKKYATALNESEEYIDTKKYFTVMIQDIDMKENNVDEHELVQSVKAVADDVECKYGTADITFFTKNVLSYRKTLQVIKSFGLGECVKDRIKEQYVKYVTD